MKTWTYEGYWNAVLGYGINSLTVERGPKVVPHE